MVSKRKSMGSGHKTKPRYPAAEPAKRIKGDEPTELPSHMLSPEEVQRLREERSVRMIAGIYGYNEIGSVAAEDIGVLKAFIKKRASDPVESQRSEQRSIYEQVIGRRRFIPPCAFAYLLLPLDKLRCEMHTFSAKLENAGSFEAFWRLTFPDESPIQAIDGSLERLWFDKKIEVDDADLALDDHGRINMWEGVIWAFGKGEILPPEWIKKAKIYLRSRNGQASKAVVSQAQDSVTDATPQARVKIPKGTILRPITGAKAHALFTLFAGKNFDSDNTAKAIYISSQSINQPRSYTANTVRKALNELMRHQYVQSVVGNNGGFWITESGRNWVVSQRQKVDS